MNGHKYTTFQIGDSEENIQQIPGEMIQSWIFDPPYNVGFKYENVKDNLSDNQYNAWMMRVARSMYDKTLEGGSCFLIHYPLQAARLLHCFEAAGWNVHQWVTWIYPHNMGMSKKRFTQGSRVVVWFSKGEPYVDIKAVPGVFKNPNDKRIKQRIAEGHSPALMDWWQINLRKNTSKGHRGYANQLPIELVKRCILTTTKEGDIVGDCMAGSGTTLEVTVQFGRYAWLNDINSKCLELWEGI